ncbi:hypothetical protein PN4B1_48940 [Paenibacillus naphthalenovorans]|uniref:hypothetical protein n=1 Tax=Paenibacillus naphthalenovorans TaxID=162209 RepID=UPI0010B69262|nr:hypothetical protein [Paenibacillus naphthalenovorans]GCL74908.1 hypothetical protein PN4B1_48940 [Paenibacillus naphthalenovorans]
MTHRLYRATDFADAVRYFSNTIVDDAPATSDEVKPLQGTDPGKWKAKPQIRDVQVYQRILRGG